MSTLTRIYTKPIFKVELGLTFELDSEKVIILEEDLVYNVKYIEPVNSGDSTNEIKEITGRLSKIVKMRQSLGFNPFYNGEVYNLIFDCSEDFKSVEVQIPTSHIRDIDLYKISEKGDNENEEIDGESGNNTGGTEEDDSTSDTGNTDNGTETGDIENDETSTGSDDGDSGSSGNDGI